jgi:cobyrinic acid a,c-diamide synthase
VIALNVARVVVAGVHSGVGKTTISTGLIGALNQAGFKVQAFKVGPDYIDPSYHTQAAGRKSENLDSWMIPRDQVIELFTRATGDVDVAVVEGVMGLYDSASGTQETGSTAEVAKILKAPVILVIDAHSMARSSAAMVLGYKTFDPNLNLAGVIVNRVGSQKHALWCKQAIESVTGVPVVGCLPSNAELKLKERHLGLVPTAESKTSNGLVDKITQAIQENLDLTKIVAIAKSAPELPKVANPVYPTVNLPKRVTIGVAFDEAFNFYYPSNLSLLEAYGAEILHFSPIHDKTLPKVDGLYFGGGFPEMMPEKLQANKNMRLTIRKASESGMPIYAECGGLMYLTDSITDFEDKTFNMVGLLHGKTVMTKKTLLNYTQIEIVHNNILAPNGSNLKGHEFHSSKVTEVPDSANFAYKMNVGEGIKNHMDGWIVNNTLAAYTHIPFVQNKALALNFIANCETFKKQKGKS